MIVEILPFRAAWISVQVCCGYIWILTCVFCGSIIVDCLPCISYHIATIYLKFLTHNAPVMKVCHMYKYYQISNHLEEIKKKQAKKTPYSLVCLLYVSYVIDIVNTMHSLTKINRTYRSGLEVIEDTPYTVKCHYNACHYNANASLTRSILGSQTVPTCPHDHPRVAQHMG